MYIPLVSRRSLSYTWFGIGNTHVTHHHITIPWQLLFLAKLTLAHALFITAIFHNKIFRYKNAGSRFGKNVNPLFSYAMCFKISAWGSGFENLEFLNVFLDSFNPKLNNHYYTCKLHFVQIQSNILYYTILYYTILYYTII